MRFSPHLTAAAAAISVVDAAALGTADECCNALARAGRLQGKVFYPDTPVYEQRLDSIYSLSAQQAPWCVVLPTSAKDASKVMKIVSKKKCPFGIRGGGHGVSPLSNSVEKGITIDFGRMNATSYDEEKGIVSLGPGTISAPAYEALEEYGVTVTVGRISPVGAAGFITGGGNSFHSGSNGWGCDNVVNFEVVLANGTIVNANEQENRDLWVALRGSSGNFGLITRFDMEAIPYADRSVPNIYGGVLQYDMSKSDAFVDAYVRFVEDTATDQHTSVGWWWDYLSSQGEWILIAVPANSANLQSTPQLSKLLDVGGITSNTLRSTTMGELTRSLNGGDEKYNIWYTSSWDLDRRMILYSQDKVEMIRQELTAALSPGGGQFFIRCQLQPITPTMVSHGEGNNVLGLESRVANGPGDMLLIYVALDTAADEAIAYPIVERYYKDIDDYATELGINWNWQYLNYANIKQQPIATYGEENVEKLRKASKKYDPNGVFQKLRGSGHKLPA